MEDIKKWFSDIGKEVLGDYIPANAILMFLFLANIPLDFFLNKEIKYIFFTMLCFYLILKNTFSKPNASFVKKIFIFLLASFNFFVWVYATSIKIHFPLLIQENLMFYLLVASLLLSITASLLFKDNAILND